MDTDVLIIGAGPTGLALALSLEKQGISFRIIDKADRPGTASRAIAVQARTLEMYDQFGFAHELTQAGLKLNKPTLWTKGKRRAVIPFGDFGAGLSPYPYLLMYPQDAHEALLTRHLKVPPQRSKVLKDFTQDERGITAVLEDGEVIRAKYICGCDGARSKCREILNAQFPGGTYEDMFFVADVDATTMAHADEFYFFMKNRGFLLVLPLPALYRFRMIGVLPEGFNKDGVTFADIQDDILSETPLRVRAAHWFSTYHVHHRVSGIFREGSAFLLGDAAHIHSPAGGQGMNTGIGDALNLGWKLGQVLRGGPENLLDTYQSERRAFAKKLVATTDRIFMSVVGHGLYSKFIRFIVFPYIIPFFMGLSFFRRFAFKTVSQLIVQYRDSALSAGRVGKIAGGDRLPWTGNNFEPLKAWNWQVHVYGTAHPDVVAYCQPKGLALMVFAWSDEAAKAGFALGALYLVRPDGYIGYAGFSTTDLRQYCEKWGI